MRNWIRKSLLWLVSLCFLAAPALGEDYDDQVMALELPAAEGGQFADLTAQSDPFIGPHEGHYLFQPGEKSPYGYADPSITVNLGTGRIYKTNYMYARVKIASPAQIRTVTTEDSLAKTTKVLGSKLAGRVKAVVAVNGVLEADVSSGGVAFVDGPVLHHGAWKRPSAKTSEAKLNNWKEEQGRDTLVIDDQGNLVVLEAESWGEIYSKILDMGDSAVNVFAFGPALVVEGEPRYGYDSRQMSSNRPAQRMAICQTGPLEYLLITSEGPEDPGSTGLKLDQFVELLASFPDIETAYNLDGGASSTLVFRKGTETWAKVNCPKSGKKRQLRDLIYFADAWLPD
ncbi:MAG: phosphodiester glycosidase family protein [Clostridia bacterium]|nr:phosphodiester glycosidase family protein [Clostridia bacterium]